MLYRPDDAGETVYVPDLVNRYTSVGGAAFTHDALNRRRSRTVSGAEIGYSRKGDTASPA